MSENLKYQIKQGYILAFPHFSNNAEEQGGFLRVIFRYFPGMRNKNVPLEWVKISDGGECDNFSHILPFLS